MNQIIKSDNAYANTTLNTVFHKKQYTLIWKISFFSLFSSIYALHNKHYDIAVVTGTVFITSIIYWTEPRYNSWQRNLDVCCVHLGLVYQLVKAYNSTYGKQYYIFTFIAIMFYLLGIYYEKKNFFWRSTYSHCLLHIFGNIANIILYSGDIR